ncbi:MAG TPA: hypothetical protein VK776_13480 [Bryobacteraceae bacterium]|nr:hypothetical protein [Bryobacteraceae bacterium]
MKSPKKLILASMLTVSLGGLLPVFAQDPNPASPAPSGGWRKFDPSNPADVPPPAPDYQEPQAQTQAPPPPGRYQTQPPPAASYPSHPAPVQPPPVYPSSITIPAGTWLTVRVDQALSSDKNHEGDYFRGTLVQPVVMNGLVVAPRGQSVTGVVTEAKKAGRVEGTSRLGLELTDIGLLDGRQLQVKTTLTERRGNTSYGRDAAAIGVTTGTGAAIGAAVNGGVGAGVGAAAGLVVSTVGVLLTRGRPTIVYPESVLSFRLANSVTVDGTQAFRPVSQQDYGMTQQRPGYGPGYGAPPPGYGAPGYGGYAAPYPYYPFYGGFGPYSGYFWSPGFNFYYGRGRRW